MLLVRLVLVIAVLVRVGLCQRFEVASIRPSEFQSADGEGSRRESIETSGDRLTLRDVTLRSCIAWAYNVQEFQIVGDLGSERFDIAAKAGGVATAAMMREMLGGLLAERFKRTFHRDAKQMASLALVVVKGGPRLTVSQEDAPGVLRPSRSATMAEYVRTLSGPLRTPVVDRTGLTGRYDFTVDLSSHFASAKGGEAPDITSIVRTALREQVGLNLEALREMVEILVIDRVERKPTGN